MGRAPLPIGPPWTRPAWLWARLMRHRQPRLPSTVPQKERELGPDPDSASSRLWTSLVLFGAMKGEKSAFLTGYLRIECGARCEGTHAGLSTTGPRLSLAGLTPGLSLVSGWQAMSGYLGVPLCPSSQDPCLPTLSLQRGTPAPTRQPSRGKLQRQIW